MTMPLTRKSYSISAFLRVGLRIALLGLFCVRGLAAQAPTDDSTNFPPQHAAVTVVSEQPRTNGAAATDVAPKTVDPAQDPPTNTELFMPLAAGTFWLYRGTVDWTDPQTDKTVQTSVTLKMTVQKVIPKPEFTIAVLSGFPRDLDWASAEVEPMPWLLIETKRHEIYLDSLPPDFDYAKLQKDAASLDKFLAEDNLLFRWPLKKGQKFGDAESLRREDGEYCWVVMDQQKKNLGDIKGLASQAAEVFLLRYATNPDDTQYEISPGIGFLSYEYHHHGTVADTSLTLVEFHPADKSATTPGVKQ
jgi:hypothetical protein